MEVTSSPRRLFCAHVCYLVLRLRGRCTLRVRERDFLKVPSPIHYLRSSTPGTKDFSLLECATFFLDQAWNKSYNYCLIITNNPVIHTYISDFVSRCVNVYVGNI